MSDIADSKAARSQSLNLYYLLSTATQTRSRRGCTVADSVASVGVSGDQDGYRGASVASLGVNMPL